MIKNTKNHKTKKSAILYNHRATVSPNHYYHNFYPKIFKDKNNIPKYVRGSPTEVVCLFYSQKSNSSWRAFLKVNTVDDDNINFYESI